MLNEIFMLKKRILQLERLRLGLDFSEENFKNFCQLKSDVSNITELQKQLNEFRQDYVEYFIPEEVMELWDKGDYEVYTDRMHHRQFWNEIENDSSVDYFIEQFFKLIGVSTCEEEKHQFRLSLYDFNNFDVYFCSEADALKFIEEYTPDCYVAFSRQEDYWREEWSD